jgi:zinc protease
MAKEGQVEPALTALFEEVLRVERHGFTAGELARAKKSVLRDYQRSVIEHDKRDGREFAAEILRNFLEGEMMPGIEAELKLVQGFLPAIELDELNRLAKEWGGADNRVILVSGPDKMAKPSPEQVLAWVDGVATREITAYRDQVSDKPLMATAPAPGSITEERTIAEIGVHEWTLSNGARVVLKPTDFQNDEIRLAAFSAGGHSLVADGDYDSARFAANIVGNSGLGDFDATALRKALAGKVAHVSAHIGELQEGMYGSASPQDLETFMQLMHLRFTAPRKDSKAFAAWRARQLEWVRNRRLEPEGAFFDDMSAVLSQDHLRRRPTTVATLDRVSLDKAFAIYRDRFADAGDFTFVFVGNIDKAKFRPLVKRYLASLPSTGRAESWKDVGARPPKGVVTKTVRAGAEPKSFVYLTFHGAEKWSPDAANDMKMLGEVLSIRLREVLREDMSGTYGSWEGGSISRQPVERRSFSVFFGCSPDNVDKLTKAVFAEAKAISKSGIGAKYIEKVKNARLRSREVELKENRFWTHKLQEAYWFGDDPREILSAFQPMVDKISSERVRNAARKYLGAKQYVLGVLRPEK